MSKRPLTKPEVEALAKLSYEKSCKPRSKQDPLMALQTIKNIHLYHMSCDLEDDDLPLYWEEDDGTIAENYPEEIKILEKIIKAYQASKRRKKDEARRN